MYEFLRDTVDALRDGPDRLQDLDELVVQRMISSTPADETVSRLNRFADLVLSKIILSEAEVERVFSRRKSIHTKMRSKLDPSIVEKNLFVRYNGKNVKIAPPEFCADDTCADDEFEALENDD